MGQIFIPSFNPALNVLGLQAPAAKMAFYLSGTNTLATIYDENGDPLSQAANAYGTEGVAADITGRFPQIYLGDETAYRVVLRTAQGAPIGNEADPYTNIEQLIINFLADVGGPAGASLIGFEQASSSTVRTVQAKLREWVSPQDYGAIGNNVAIDNTALTNAKGNNPNALLNGAAGTFRINQNLVAGFNMINGRIIDTRTVNTQDEYTVVAIGYNALAVNAFVPEVFPSSGANWAAGNYNIAIGGYALQANTEGRRNTAIGGRSLSANTTGYYNTALGSFTLQQCSTGYNNNAIGVQALQALTTGYGNVAVGTGTAARLTVGFFNTGVGELALSSNTTLANMNGGSYNVALGYRALFANETGTNNVALGADAMVSSTTAGNCVAVGREAMLNTTTANNLTALGYQALRAVTTTSGFSVAVGYQSLLVQTTATQNTAVGYQSGLALTTNGSCSFFGYRAGLTATGANNSFFGSEAGRTIVAGGSNTMVGYQADGTASGTNQTSLGNGATCTGDNQITLGNASITTIRAQVTSITSLSDRRFKTKVQPLEYGLSFINDLKIRSFEWNGKGGTTKGHREVGIIAQELQEVAEKYGAEWMGLVDTSNPDRLEATAGKLLFVLLKGFQEMSAKVDRLEAQLGAR